MPRGDGIDLGDAADDEDYALAARKKLGIPEYDPNASLIQTLPKILLLGCVQFCLRKFVRAPSNSTRLALGKRVKVMEKMKDLLATLKNPSRIQQGSRSSL